MAPAECRQQAARFSRSRVQPQQLQQPNLRRRVLCWYAVYRRVLQLVVAGLAALLVPGAGAAAQMRFSEQAQAAGLTARHRPSLETLLAMTAGGAAADFDNDGWQDLYFVAGGGAPDRFYLNNGDGTFTDHAAAAGLGRPHLGHGVAVGDYDGDGWVDIFLTSFGPAEHDRAEPGQHLLFRNRGPGPDGVPTFSDVARTAHVSRTSTSVASGMGAAFGDYDLDGDLDLFVAAWMSGAYGNLLFRNNGDGTFGNATHRAGLALDGVRGFAASFADMDGDRYPELLVAADAYTSRYFVNRGDGTFADATDASGTGLDANGMGHVTGDFDNDGRLDWYVTSVHGIGGYDVPWDAPAVPGTGNMLYRNLGGHRYDELAGAAGVSDGGWGWGAVAVDLDHDGDQDLVTTNGWAELNAAGRQEWLHERTYLFRNELQPTGALRFSEVGAAAGLDHAGEGRGLIHLDYDNDGDQDLVIFDALGPISLYRNDLAGPGTHWLRLFLDTSAAPGLAPNGRGARIELSAGGRRQYRYLDGGCTYLGSAELSAHFGLGRHRVAQRVRVEWPDGRITDLHDIAADRTLCIRPTGAVRQCAAGVQLL